jgi:hypothetical protein
MDAPCGFLRIHDRSASPMPATLGHHTGSRSLTGSFKLFSKRAGAPRPTMISNRDTASMHKGLRYQSMPEASMGTAGLSALASNDHGHITAAVRARATDGVRDGQIIPYNLANA